MTMYPMRGNPYGLSDDDEAFDPYGYLQGGQPSPFSMPQNPPTIMMGGQGGMGGGFSGQGIGQLPVLPPQQPAMQGPFQPGQQPPPRLYDTVGLESQIGGLRGQLNDLLGKTYPTASYPIPDALPPAPVRNVGAENHQTGRAELIAGFAALLGGGGLGGVVAAGQGAQAGLVPQQDKQWQAQQQQYQNALQQAQQHNQIVQAKYQRDISRIDQDRQNDLKKAGVLNTQLATAQRDLANARTQNSRLTTDATAKPLDPSVVNLNNAKAATEGVKPGLIQAQTDATGALVPLRQAQTVTEGVKPGLVKAQTDATGALVPLRQAQTKQTQANTARILINNQWTPILNQAKVKQIQSSINNTESLISNRGWEQQYRQADQQFQQMMKRNQSELGWKNFDARVASISNAIDKQVADTEVKLRFSGASQQAIDTAMAGYRQQAKEAKESLANAASQGYQDYRQRLNDYATLNQAKAVQKVLNPPPSAPPQAPIPQVPPGSRQGPGGAIINPNPHPYPVLTPASAPRVAPTRRQQTSPNERISSNSVSTGRSQAPIQTTYTEAQMREMLKTHEGRLKLRQIAGQKQ